MLDQILALNLFAFFLIFARVGAAFLFLPGFSAVWVNVRTRLMLALTISFLLMPILTGSLPGLPSSVAALSLILAGEIIVGGFLGIIGRVLISALQTAGTLIAYLSSMANAMIQDPIAEQQSSTISSFLSTTGIVILFVTDMHHLMLRAIVDSYFMFVPGMALDFGAFANIIARRMADSFALGLQLAAPFVITAMTYYIGLGLLGRLMPALPVFFVGLPIQVAMQMVVITLVFSSLMLVFLDYFEEGMSAFLVL